MPQNITGTNVNTSPIVVPDNGDPVDGAGLALAAQGLANKSVYTQDKILGLSSNRYVAIPLTPIYNNSNIWAPVEDSAGMATWQQTTSGGGQLQFPIPAIPFGFLKEAHIYLIGQGHGALPAQKPRLRVWKKQGLTTLGNPITLGVIEGATITDSSGSVAAYEEIHTLAKTGMSLPLDYPNQYFINVIGESGANAIANGLLLYNIVIQVGA